MLDLEAYVAEKVTRFFNQAERHDPADFATKEAHTDSITELFGVIGSDILIELKARGESLEMCATAASKFLVQVLDCPDTYPQVFSALKAHLELDSADVIPFNHVARSKPSEDN